MLDVDAKIQILMTMGVYWKGMKPMSGGAISHEKILEGYNTNQK